MIFQSIYGWMILRKFAGVVLASHVLQIHVIKASIVLAVVLVLDHLNESLTSGHFENASTNTRKICFKNGPAKSMNL